jgi:hypothetical protein
MRMIETMRARESLRTALRALGRGAVEDAVGHLRSLVESCPVSKRAVLSRSLYWLGISLLREGNRATALRSLASAQRLVKRGNSRSLYLRFSNGYGMVKLATPHDDDRAAFHSIQLSRYLARRSRRSFSSNCERDMVHALITDAWSDLERSGALKNQSTQEKLASFKAVRIVFPMRGPERAFEAACIPVDFMKGEIPSTLGLCICGSGLPFLRCCGRRASVSETEHGYF